MSDLHKVMAGLFCAPFLIYAASFVSGAFAVVVGAAIILPLFAYTITRP
jgi:hypothetical protein